jgi:hypothetical protein
MITCQLRSILLLGLAACFGIIAMTVNAGYGEIATIHIQLLGICMLISAACGLYFLQKKPKTEDTVAQAKREAA